MYNIDNGKVLGCARRVTLHFSFLKTMIQSSKINALNVENRRYLFLSFAFNYRYGYVQN